MSHFEAANPQKLPSAAYDAALTGRDLRIESLTKALQELVRLKDIKEKLEGEHYEPHLDYESLQHEYASLKEPAWQAARAALQEYSPRLSNPREIPWSEAVETLAGMRNLQAGGEICVLRGETHYDLTRYRNGQLEECPSLDTWEPLRTPWRRRFFVLYEERFVITEPTHPDLPKFTPRESTTAGLLCEGLSNKQIAARIGTGEQNVKMYVSRLMRLLGCKNRVQVVLKLGKRES